MIEYTNAHIHEVEFLIYVYLNKLLKPWLSISLSLSYMCVHVKKGLPYSYTA